EQVGQRLAVDAEQRLRAAADLESGGEQRIVAADARQIDAALEIGQRIARRRQGLLVAAAAIVEANRGDVVGGEQRLGELGVGERVALLVRVREIERAMHAVEQALAMRVVRRQESLEFVDVLALARRIELAEIAVFDALEQGVERGRRGQR